MIDGYLYANYLRVPLCPFIPYPRIFFDVFRVHPVYELCHLSLVSMYVLENKRSIFHKATSSIPQTSELKNYDASIEIFDSGMKLNLLSAKPVWSGTKSSSTTLYVLPIRPHLYHGEDFPHNFQASIRSKVIPRGRASFYIGKRIPFSLFSCKTKPFPFSEVQDFRFLEFSRFGICAFQELSSF